jgi:hypothetical protein
MRRILILVAAVALLTTACKVEINANFEINADKTGTIALEMGIDDEFAEFMASMSDEPFDAAMIFEDIDLESGPGAVTSEERRGDMTFYIVTIPVDDITEPQSLGGEATAGLTDDITVTFTDELVSVMAIVDTADAFGDSGELDMVPPEMLTESFAVNIRITMPGKILSHNADSQDGNTLTWNIDLATGGALDIQAESDPRGSESSGIPIWIFIAAGAVLVALIGWFLLKGRGGSKPAASPAAGAPPAPEGFAPPPPPSE